MAGTGRATLTIIVPQAIEALLVASMLVERAAREQIWNDDLKEAARLLNEVRRAITVTR